MPPTEQTPYRDRFAPSPTGALHFGSLLAALASFLDARHRGGRWLVRIEDLDPPREVAGAADAILHTLEAFHLHWDEPVVFQSREHERYRALVDQLLRQGYAYHCDCSRAEAARRGLVYDGYCRRRRALARQPAAVRLQTDNRAISFCDSIQGRQRHRLEEETGDFVIHRKDGLFAYQLAVVADDAQAGITHVVRGCDLLDSTPRQLYLQQLLGYATPRYSHIPVLVNDKGQKLSKQTYATALTPKRPGHDLFRALDLLGQTPPQALQGSAPPELLAWAAEHWRGEAIPRRATLPESRLRG